MADHITNGGLSDSELLKDSKRNKEVGDQVRHLKKRCNRDKNQLEWWSQFLSWSSMEKSRRQPTWEKLILRRPSLSLSRPMGSSRHYYRKDCAVGLLFLLRGRFFGFRPVRPASSSLLNFTLISLWRWWVYGPTFEFYQYNCPEGADPLRNFFYQIYKVYERPMPMAI